MGAKQDLVINDYSLKGGEYDVCIIMLVNGLSGNGIRHL